MIKKIDNFVNILLSVVFFALMAYLMVTGLGKELNINFLVNNFAATSKISNKVKFVSEKIPYDVETHYSDGSLKTAIRITGISCKDDENYVTKNRDVEITIYYEILYNRLRDDIYAIDITDANGNYPLIQDGRTYGNSNEKREAKDIYLDLWTREAHTNDSVTFYVKDIEKGTYNLLVRSTDK